MQGYTHTHTRPYVCTARVAHNRRMCVLITILIWVFDDSKGARLPAKTDWKCHLTNVIEIMYKANNIYLGILPIILFVSGFFNFRGQPPQKLTQPHLRLVGQVMCTGTVHVELLVLWFHIGFNKSRKMSEIN